MKTDKNLKKNPKKPEQKEAKPIQQPTNQTNNVEKEEPEMVKIPYDELTPEQIKNYKKRKEIDDLKKQLEETHHSSSVAKGILIFILVVGILALLIWLIVWACSPKK